jgi:hypothetical protein
MLRGILISKIRNNNIDLTDFNNIVKTINSRINNYKKISDEEYNFYYSISDNYPKNLRIRMPIFDILDAFYLFFKYDKENQYKLVENLSETNYNFS